MFGSRALTGFDHWLSVPTDPPPIPQMQALPMEIQMYQPESKKTILKAFGSRALTGLRYWNYEPADPPPIPQMQALPMVAQQ